jgi:hypothetical protein
MVDDFLKLSAAQAVTASAVSANTVDLSVARDIGAGEELHVQVTVDESFATATSVQIQVITSATENLGSPTVLVETPAIAIAQLTAGRRPINIRVPRTLLTTAPVGQRYFGLNYVIGGSSATAGKLTAYIVKDVQDVGKVYASGFSVS